MVRRIEVGLQAAVDDIFRTKGSGYNMRLPPRFFAHIRDKLSPAHLRSGLNRAPRTE
jgi:hypothetical protein